ncbi:hypothetical protein [Cohnella thermotolerans]|uniref:hypothetical protein n=1 Tax=Cohnella thermotolerans TaxID=329858 RepID=UPI000550E09F|nr:hypothetical protein [Cohnella thermotolerans]
MQLNKYCRLLQVQNNVLCRLGYPRAVFILFRRQLVGGVKGMNALVKKIREPRFIQRFIAELIADLVMLIGGLVIGYYLRTMLF